MEDVFDAAWQDASTAGSQPIEAELASLIDIYGFALLEQPEQLRLLLSRACPTEPRQVAMIVAALNAQVPQGLRTAQGGDGLPNVLRRSALHLQAHASIDPGWASWAVRAWAHALALPTTGDWATATIPAGRASAATPVDDASAFGDFDDGDGHGAGWPSPPDDVASVFARQGSGMARPAGPPPRTPADAGAPSLPPADPPAPTPAAKLVPDATPIRAHATPPTVAPVDDPWSRREPVLSSGDDADPAAVEPPGGPIFVEPLFSERDILRIAHTASGIGIAAGNAKSPPASGASVPVDADGARGGAATVAPPVPGPVADPIVAPAWTPPRDSVRRSLAWPVALAVVAVAIPIAAWFWLMERRTDDAPPAAPVAAATTSRAAQGVPPAASPPASSAALSAASSATTPAASSAAFPAASPTSPSSAAPGGDPASPAASSNVDRSPPAPTTTPAVDGRSATVGEPAATPPTPGAGPSAVPGAAPSEAMPATTPSADGAVRSPATTVPGAANPSGPSAAAPQATTATPAADATPQPSAGSRPAIARIDVPRVVEGDPFAVTLRLAGSARDIVAVERRIVDAGGLWPRTGPATQTVAWRRTGANTLQVPFRAMDAPSSAALEFTVVARDGTRSAPQPVTIVLAGATSIGSGASTGGAASAAMSAPMSAAAAAATCTPSTCGTVVEARELVTESDTGRLLGLRSRDDVSVYQIVVRMDDRETRTFSAQYRLQVNSRVRLVDQRLVPIAMSAR